MPTSPPAQAQFVQQGAKLVGTGVVGGAQQGRSVAVSADGNTAIVGGSVDNAAAGAVWVYTRAGGVWSQQGAKLVGTGAAGAAQQGWSVALSDDGNTAIVGGPFDNFTGAVWVYTRAGGVWSQQGAKLVGSGAVGPATQGRSVALSADGNTAIVGGTDDGVSGAVWVFTRSGGVWSQQGAKLVGSGAVGNAKQGGSIALSSDGNTAIIGGSTDNSNVGAVWVFTRAGGVWSQQGSKLVGTGAVGNAQQGTSVALSGDGNTAIVGGLFDNSFAGAVWVYTRAGGVWSQQGSKLVGTGAVGNAQQGWSIALSSDGNTAIVGGNADNSAAGAAWVFGRIAAAWTQRGGKLVGTGAVGNAQQGRSVALSSDGNTALIGGAIDNTNIGATWAFQQTFPILVCNPVPRLGDFNGDGRADMLLRRAIGTLAQYQMNGFDVADARIIGAVGTEWTLIGAADFNGDGRSDMLFQRLSDGLLAQYQLNGFAITAAQLIGQIGTDWDRVGLGDFDGDGRADMLFRRSSDGLLAMYLMNGFVITVGQVIGAIGIDWSLIGVGDFDGDGRADMLFRRSSDGLLAMYLMNGLNISASQIIGAIGSEWSLISVGDFNGDGRADMLMRRAIGTLAQYQMNGFNVISAKIIGAVGSDWTPVGTGDMNGDGRADMLFRHGNNALAEYQMDGFTILDAQVFGPIGNEWNSCPGIGVQ